jgi:transposase
MILGIDIAKDKFDIALCQDNQVIASGQFDNRSAGFKKLSKWLRKKADQSAGSGTRQVWACLEATGRYGDALALYLYEQGHQVSMVNPARIKKYAESKLQCNKTDKLDARLIADFCRTQKPVLWTPPPLERRQLQEMVRRRNALVQEQTREKNRLQSGLESNIVQESIRVNLDFLKEQIAKLEDQIQAHINQHPSLKRDHELLISIKGIGAKTAAIILGELPQVDRFDNSGQVVAYGGLSPQQHQSGSSVHKKTKLTKMGNQRLKTTLYFPALTAIKCNPIIIKQSARLAEKGKEKMVIVGAAMRKLLQLAYGVLKSGQPFDPDYATKS